MRAPGSIRIERVLGSLLVFFLILATLGCNGGAHPPSLDGDQTIWWVSTTGDDQHNTCHSSDSPCRTIFWAVYYAHNGATINIADGVYDEQITIVQDNITLQGSGPNTIITASSFRDQGGVFFIKNAYSGGVIRLVNLTVQGGNATLGGSIYVNAEALDLLKVWIKNGQAESGGCLYIDGYTNVLMDQVTMEGCQATGTGPENGGGAIFNRGDIYSKDILLRNNTAAFNGGGLYNLGHVELHGGNIEGNHAAKGGGIYHSYVNDLSQLFANGITVMSNEAVNGAGLAVAFTSDAGIFAGLQFFEIEQSTIAYNHAAASGGGLYSDQRGGFFLTNVTISNNEAGDTGGGIETASDHYYGLLLNVTIAYNTAPYSAGVKSGGGRVEMQNVLLALNSNENCRATYGGAIISNAGNLSDDTTCQFTHPYDQNGVPAGIGSLMGGSGSTPTITLHVDSPAVDSAVGWLAPQVDQRDAPRGLDGNGDGVTGFDIGAYELTSIVMSGQSSNPIVTTTPGIGSFTFIQPGNCRSGPGVAYSIITSIPVGTVARVEGRNPDASWYRLQLTDTLCWVSAGIGTIDSNPLGFPVREAPPSPTPPPAELPVVCSDYLTSMSCAEHPADCVWLAPRGVPPYCAHR